MSKVPPKGFQFDRARLYAAKFNPEAKQDEKISGPICGPIYITGSTRDEFDENHGREFEFTRENGEKMTAVIPNAELQGGAADVRRRLAGLGFWISTERREQDHFIRFLNTTTSGDTIVTVSSQGWHQEVRSHEDGKAEPLFIDPLGDVVYPGRPVLADDSPFTPRMLIGDFMYRLREGVGVQDKSVGGTFSAWQKGVGNKIFREELPHFVLGLAAGCAGTVIQRANEDSCGLHFMGASSHGKSTAQRIGAGCWANPAVDKGLLISARSTDNAFDARFGLSTGASIHVDEARTGHEKIVANMAFQYASGAGKSRLNKTTELRRTSTWQGIMTLSSEKSLSHYAAKAGEQVIAGAVVRLPSVDVSSLPQIDGAEFTAIKDAAKENYGHVGRRFARICISWEPAELRELIDRASDDIAYENDDDADSSSTVERARRVFAILLVTLRLMKMGEIINATDEQIMHAVVWGWQSFLDTSEATALDPANQSTNALLRWLRCNPQQVRPIGDKYSYREVLAWYDETTVYIPADNFAKIPPLTTTPKAVLDELKERKMLRPASDKNLRHTYIPRHGPESHYRLSFAVEVTGNTAEEQKHVQEVRESGGNVFTKAAATA